LSIQKLIHNEAFRLEKGEVLSGLEIAYTTHGNLNPRGDNVIWICHAITANSDPAEWWPGLTGPGKLYDTNHYYVVCANIIGSCYGTTSPVTINPQTGIPYGGSFPDITVRDMIKAHQILQQHLGVNGIFLATGGSMGGQQVLEWAIEDPDLFAHLFLIGTNARHSPWGIAFNEAQRMALEADQTLWDGTPDAGKAGLEAARAIAMLSYRNYRAYWKTQLDEDTKLDGYKAVSYQRYQGLKLSRRFDALSYLVLSKAMDTHDVGRSRGGLEAALFKIKARVLVIGIESDYLFPLVEQRFLCRHIPDSTLRVIDSDFGHDGFLIENEKITRVVREFLENVT